MSKGIAVVNQKSDSGDQALQIFESLRAEIISGELAPNSAIKQESIAVKYGVSRMPVREALNRLELLGYVTVNHNRRTHVASKNLDDLLEIYDMRIAAEVLAIRSAIPHLTNAQIDAAKVIQDEIEVSRLSDFGPLNVSFHTVLYEPSGRARLLGHIAVLGDAANRYTFMEAVDRDFVDRSHREHRELLEACYKRDEDRAVACIRDHITHARDSFAKMMDRA